MRVIRPETLLKTNNGAHIINPACLYYLSWPNTAANTTTCYYQAAYMRNSGQANALQSQKWQLIGVS